MIPDATIHEPARLLIMSILSRVASADFALLLTTTSLTKGNLSSHMARLERAGYVEITKSFQGKLPHTDYRLTPAGAEALKRYWEEIDTIRAQYAPEAGS
jgi:DNA-binding transcriptional ArsR family regulator